MVPHATGQPQNDQNLLNVAINFEREALVSVSSPAEYHNRLKQRLAYLSQLRNQGLRNMPMGMNAQNPAMSGHPMMQRPGGFPPGTQQFPQNSMQMPLGVNQAGMMRGGRGAGGGGALGQPNMSMIPPRAQMSGNLSQPPMFPQQNPNTGGLQTSIPPEQISKMVMSSYNQAKATGKLDQLREQAPTALNPGAYQLAISKGQDPAVFLLRQEILSRASRSGAAQQMDASSNVQQLHQNNQNNGAANMSTMRSQSNEKPADVVNQISSQQADARRQQDSGDLVVPASDNRFQGQFPQSLSNLGVANSTPVRPMSRTVPNRDMNQLNSTQYAGMSSMSNNQPKFNTQSVSLPQQQLPGALIGGNLNVSQQIPEHSPMPTLNKPHELVSGTQRPNPFPVAPRNPQPSPKPDASLQPGAQNNPAFMRNMFGPNANPMEIRRRIMNLDPSQQRQAFENYRRQMASANAFPNPNSQIGQPSGSMSNVSSLARSNQPPNASMNGISNPAGNVPRPFQHTTMPANLQNQIFVDRIPLPLDKLHNEYPALQIPKEAVTWGDLKKFISAHPQTVSNEDRARLSRLQQAQWQFLQQRNRASAQLTIDRPYVDVPVDKMQAVSELARQNVIEVHNSQVRLKDTTDQDLQAFRTQNPSTTADGRLPDAQAKAKILGQRLRTVTSTMGPEIAECIGKAFQQGVQPRNQPIPQGVPGMSGPAGSQQQPSNQTQIRSNRQQLGQQGTNSGEQTQKGLTDLQSGSNRVAPSAPMKATSANVTNAQNSGMVSNGMTNEPRGRPTGQQQTALRGSSATMSGEGAPVRAGGGGGGGGGGANDKSNNNSSSSSSSSSSKMATKSEQQSQGPSQTPLAMREQRLKVLVHNAEAKHPRGPQVELTVDERATMQKMMSSLVNKITPYMMMIKTYYHRTGADNVVFDLLESVFLIRNQLNPHTDQETIKKGGEDAFLFTARPQDLFQPFKRLDQFATRYMAASKGARGGNTTQSSSSSIMNTAPSITQPVATSSTPTKAPAMDASSAPGDGGAAAEAGNNKQPTKQEQQPGQTIDKTTPNDAKPPSGQAQSLQAGPTGQPTADGSVQYLNEDTFKQLNIPPSKLKKVQTLQQSGQHGDNKTAPGIATHPSQSDPSTKAVAGPTKTIEIKALPFLCFETMCSYHFNGFATEKELKDHEKSVHESTGGSAKLWCLAQMKKALGVDKPAASLHPSRATAENNSKAPEKNKNFRGVHVSRTAFKQETNKGSQPLPKDHPVGTAIHSQSGPSEQGKRDSSALGITEDDNNSPPKRARSNPLLHPSWHESRISPTTMRIIFGDIPYISDNPVDLFAGFQLPSFEPTLLPQPSDDIEGGEILTRASTKSSQDGEDMTEEQTEQSIRALWENSAERIQELFNEDERQNLPFALRNPGFVPDHVDWQVRAGIAPYHPPEPEDMITDEMIEDFLRNDSEN